MTRGRPGRTGRAARCHRHDRRSPAGGISYVVDPSLRRRGYCAAVVGAVLMMPCLEHVELFAAGVGSACAGLADCLRRAGFEPLNAGPDWEGMIYYAWFRHPAEPR